MMRRLHRPSTMRTFLPSWTIEIARPRDPRIERKTIGNGAAGDAVGAAGVRVHPETMFAGPGRWIPMTRRSSRRMRDSRRQLQLDRPAKKRGRAVRAAVAAEAAAVSAT